MSRMIHSFNCIFVVVISVWLTLGHADQKRRLLTRICQRFFADAKPPTTRFDQIHPQVRRWIKASRNDFWIVEFGHRQGESIVIDNHAYRIITVLGRGSENVVYLVEDSDGFKVAKQFRPVCYEHSRRSWQKAAEYLPAVIARDDSIHTLIIEYVEGIPYDQIGRAKFGWSFAQRSEIERKFQKLAGEVLEHTGYIASPDNVLYVPGQDRFRLIDPH